jgi:hypothetical protein
MEPEIPYREEVFIINDIEVVVRGKFTEVEVDAELLESPLEVMEEIPESKDDW